VEGVAYEWREYVLFNEHRGFRYLTEYNGHWNDVKPVRNLPVAATAGGRRAQTWMGRTYKHFQTAVAETVYVSGEFPWRVQVGEKVSAEDFVSPPYLLSSEQNLNEVTWSHGEYVAGQEIWTRFGLKTAPPAVSGAYANEPSPYDGAVAGIWRTFLALAGLLAASYLLFSLFMGNEEAFKKQLTFDPANNRGEASFVTPIFELKGRASNVEAIVETDLQNNWIYFNLALVNDDTGQALEWGREVSYYEGRDGDGSWNEGKRQDRSKLGHVPAGRYYLRVEPEWQAEAGSVAAAQPVNYTLTLRRDVPIFWPYPVAFGLLLLPAAVVSLRAWAFEASRWQESDYGSSSKEDDDD
jgi:hypothetical protein